MRRSATPLIFSGLVLFFLSITLIWLRLDQSAPTWDDAIYLSRSLVLYDTLTESGLLRYAERFLSIADDKPPLLSALPTPVYLIAGRHRRVAYAVNLLFLLILFVAVFRIARRFATARAGLLAVYLAATMPMLYGLSRWFLVECGLMAIVAMAICALWESDDLANTGKVVAFGFLSGIGLLLKFSFPLYILAPLLFCALRGWRAGARFKTALAFTLPVIVLAMPWYAVNFRSALKTAVDTGSAETMAQFFGTADVHSLGIIAAYLGQIFNAGPVLYFGALPILLILVYRKLSPDARAGLWLCALWASPILFLLVWPSREVRYAAPLYPALAVALAVLIDSALGHGRKWRYILATVLLALPLADMLQVSFHLFGKRQFELGGLLLNPQKLVYAQMYDSWPWPQREILEDLHRLARDSGRAEESLLVVTDSACLNADTFKLAALEARLPVQVATTAYEKDWNTVGRLLDWASFVVYEEGGPPNSIYFNLQGKEALKEVRESGRFVDLHLSRELPDHGVAHVFENISKNGFIRTGTFLPSGRQTIPNVEIGFAGVLELSGLSFQQKDGNLEVKYRWRSLRPVDREYWCFTHILDARGNVVAYLDHRILNGDPPMETWKEGDMALESLSSRSPSIQNGENYRLKIGLYDRASGARLPISSSMFPLTDGGTAVVVDLDGQR